MAFMAIAIVTGIGGAFASWLNDFCEYQPQYYKYGNSYFPAGTYGVDYICISSIGVCTYYKSVATDPNSFAPCRTGYLEFLYLKKPQKK